MYRPLLLLPSDDYRGSINELSFIASGMVFEYTAFWLVGFLCFVFATLKTSTKTYIFSLLPLIIFDIFFLIIATFRLFKSYNWLLQSERRYRIIDLFSLLGRLFFCGILLSVIYGALHLKYLLFTSIFLYVTTVTLNSWAQSAYVWFRVNLFELVVCITIINIYLQYMEIIKWHWCLIFWPEWVLSIIILVVAFAIWELARVEDEVTLDIVLKIFISGLVLMACFFQIFLRFFSRWLEFNDLLTTSWGIPLIIAQMIGIFYSLIVAIVFTAHRQQSGEGNRDCEEINFSANNQNPLLVRNMQITLNKVGNNFYKLTVGDNHSLLSSLPSSSIIYPAAASSVLNSFSPFFSYSSLSANANCVEESNIHYNSEYNKMNDLVPRILETSSKNFISESTINISVTSPLIVSNQQDDIVSNNFSLSRDTSKNIDSTLSTDTFLIIDPFSEISNCSTLENSRHILSVSNGTSFHPIIPKSLVADGSKKSSSYPTSLEGAVINIDGDENETCIICFQNPCNAVFLYCGHGGMCFNCAQLCFRRNKQCPSCRTRIKGVAQYDADDAKKKTQIIAKLRDVDT